MKVLIACEFSGIVRDAFRAKGHDATSLDLLESERPGPHIRADIRSVNLTGYDLLIAFPPCTRLAASGARWWADYPGEQEEALALVRFLLAAPVPRIALENPVGAISTAIRKPNQIIQPWQHGHPVTKATCLWLVGLPLLRPTDPVKAWKSGVHAMGETADRWKRRSRTYTGIAAAMAAQWGAR